MRDMKRTLAQSGTKPRVDIEEHLVNRVKKRQKKVDSLERELQALRAHIATLFESFSVPTYPEDYDAVTGCFENAAVALETGNNITSISSTHAPECSTSMSTFRLEFVGALQRYEHHMSKAKKEGPTRRGIECRPDIVAFSEMRKAGENLNSDVTVGGLPGLVVGDVFTYRHQMAAVGIHRMPNAGIDYSRVDVNPVAAAIVLVPKAGYVDDRDNGDTILYTGQGGRKKHSQAAPVACDQVLKRGNLALAKNHERNVPVRVIRGHSALGSNGPGGMLGYTYDGLYRITDYEFSLGLDGFKVYKYSLQRLAGQVPIPQCIAGCTAHGWNNVRTPALGVLPLQEMNPFLAVEDVKQE